MINRVEKIVDTFWAQGFRPDPILTVSQWADRHRILSRKASAEPGKYRTSRTPYLKEIMDRLSSDDPTRKIVFMKAAQVGATECGINWIGYIIDHAPAPTLMVMPTVETAKRNSKLRIDPLIEESPRLQEKIAAPKSRDGGNTILQKDFRHGALVIAGANSGVGLRSMPARFLLLDEIDGYPFDVDGEGDPITVALQRSKTFPNRKAFLISTPTIEGASKIQTEFEASDKRYYFVACPHCKEFQTLKWPNIRYKLNKSKQLLPKSVLYFCDHCGVGIEEKYKTKMLAGGYWKATDPEKDVVGYHLNSLYSPVGWYSWVDIVKEFLGAKKDPEKLKSFVNTTLGETWKEKGDAPKWKNLYRRRESYEIGIVPVGGYVLTAGVDVQKDRFEMEVVAWGKNKENWSVDYIVIPGDTGKDETWDELEKVITQTYKNHLGLEIPISFTAIDSGYETQKVYNFVRRFMPNRVGAIKGSESLTVMVGIPKPVDIKIQGKYIKRGTKVWPVGVSVIKRDLYSYLKIEPPLNEGDPFPHGFSHFPQYGEEFFKQLTAEEARTKKNLRGFHLTEWVKIRERNEVLDCRVYNRAAASILGIDRFTDKDWEKSQKNLTVAKKLKKNDTKKEPRNKRKRERSSSSSSFWG